MDDIEDLKRERNKPEIRISELFFNFEVKTRLIFELQLLKDSIS